MLNALICYAAMASVFLFGGGLDSVEIIEWDVSFEASVYSAQLHIDPIFLVWTERDFGGAAFALGNVIVVEDDFRGTQEGRYIVHHELNHVKQFRALGWLIYPAYWLGYYQIEAEHPDGWVADFDHPEDEDELMWLPEEGSRERYHFLTLELRFGS